MKKLVLLLSFVFVFAIIGVNAEGANKVVKKEPVKTEQPAKKKVVRAKKGTKKVAVHKATPKTVEK